MTLLTIRSIINRICGIIMIIGLPCIIIGIILIVKNKSKKSKTCGIILICIPPLAFMIQFVSSLVFHNLVLKEYENNLPQQDIIAAQENQGGNNPSSQEWNNPGTQEWINPSPK